MSRVHQNGRREFFSDTARESKLVTDRKNLGKELTEARIKAGFSNRNDLIKEIKHAVTLRTLIRIERGHPPGPNATLRTMRILAAGIRRTFVMEPRDHGDNPEVPLGMLFHLEVDMWFERIPESPTPHQP